MKEKNAKSIYESFDKTIREKTQPYRQRKYTEHPIDKIRRENHYDISYLKH